MKKGLSQKGGFIEILIVIIIALLLLNYMGVDIKSILAQPWVKQFTLYVIQAFKVVWNGAVDIFTFIKTTASIN